MFQRYPVLQSHLNEWVEQIVYKGHITQEKWEQLDDRAKETAAPIICILCGDNLTLDPDKRVVCRSCNAKTYFQAVRIDGEWMLQPWVEESASSDTQILKERTLEHSQSIECLSCGNSLIPDSRMFPCATCEVEMYFQCVHIDGTLMIQRQATPLDNAFYDTPVPVVFPTEHEKNATTATEPSDTSKLVNDVLQELIEEKGVPCSTAYRQTQEKRQQEVAALKAEAIRLHEETHLTLEEIGLEVGRDKGTVSQWLKAHKESANENTAAA